MKLLLIYAYNIRFTHQIPIKQPRITISARLALHTTSTRYLRENSTHCRQRSVSPKTVPKTKKTISRAQLNFPAQPCKSARRHQSQINAGEGRFLVSIICIASNTQLQQRETFISYYRRCTRPSLSLSSSRARARTHTLV